MTKIELMQQVAQNTKEANEAIQFAMRRLTANNEKMAEIMKELENAKKS